MCFLYDSAIMTEAQLPQIHVKKDKKRRHESQQLGVVKKKARLVSEEVPPAQPGITNRPPRLALSFIQKLIWFKLLYRKKSQAIFRKLWYLLQ